MNIQFSNNNGLEHKLVNLSDAHKNHILES